MVSTYTQLILIFFKINLITVIPHDGNSVVTRLKSKGKGGQVTRNKILKKKNLKFKNKLKLKYIDIILVTIL